jgi:hypothetical protein
VWEHEDRIGKGRGEKVEERWEREEEKWKREEERWEREERKEMTQDIGQETDSTCWKATGVQKE